MKTLKLVSVILLICACTGLLAACGSSKSTGKNPPCADVTSAIAKEVAFKDELVMLEDGLIPNYYRIDWEKVEDKSMYASGTRATAEEIMVFKLKDEKDVGLAQAAIKERIDDQKASYESYVPAEMTKLGNALVMTNGKYVAVVVADDVSKAQAAFEAQL